MKKKTALIIFLLTGLLLTACSPAAIPLADSNAPETAPVTTLVPTAEQTVESEIPVWFTVEMTDVVSGQTFTMNDFAGKVVLLETMATWCPTCLKQANEVKKLKEMLGDAKDVVLLTLDVDLNEDEDVLKEYTNLGGFDWRFAVAPISVQRDLGNLYTAELLNPPLAPMLIIDREGKVFGLPNGIKNAESLQKTIETHLVPQE